MFPGTPWVLAALLAAPAAGLARPDQAAGTAAGMEPASVAATAPTDPSHGPEAEQDRPFQHLFSNLVRDARHLLAPDALWIGGAGVIGGLAVRHDDARLSRWASARGPASYTSAGAMAGDGWTQGGIAVGTYVTGVLTRSRRTTHIGSDLVRAQVLNGVLTRGLKLAVQRERPSGSPDSLPSGHTSAAFATAAVLQHELGWRAGSVAYAGAAFVGWTRIRDNRHWLSDAVVGAALGTLAGRAVTRTHATHAWVVVPVKTAGITALYVTFQ